MRISDWSSDVCSSDLDGRCRREADQANQKSLSPSCESCVSMRRIELCSPICSRTESPSCKGFRSERLSNCRRSRRSIASLPISKSRSEEHTSELQSLMRISYAVFCLKKKKNTTETLYK